MSGVSLRAVVLPGVAYALLNQFWLAGGNAPWVGEGQRTLVKGASLLLAAGIFVTAVIGVMRQTQPGWLKATALTVGLGAGLGLTLMILTSMLWYRGQFFHDSDPVQRAPTLLLLIAAVVLGAGGVGVLLGLLVRSLWRSSIS